MSPAVEIVVPSSPPLSFDDKKVLWKQLVVHVAAELDSMTRNQKETHASATHEEAKPEHSKDTRALEQTHLARGLAVRVAELRDGLQMLEAFAVKSFGDDDPIAITALVTVEDDDGRSMTVLLAPFGGGLRLPAPSGDEARVVTADSPLGKALLGRRVGDDAELAGPKGKRELEITAVC